MNTQIKNNNNKFYIIQILSDVTGRNSQVFIRYGRVGEVGVSDHHRLNNIEACKKLYQKKFNEKTSARKGYIAIALKTAEEKEATKSLSIDESSASTAPSS